MRWLILVSLLWPLVAGAAETPIRITPGCTLVWNYETHAQLAYFALFKRTPEQSFPATPIKVIPAMELLVLGIPCSSVPWGSPGLYYIALKAFPTGQEEDLQPSGLSNELLVQWGEAVDVSPPITPPPDPSLVPPLPPKTFLTEKPPPLTTGPKSSPRPPAGQGKWFTETCGYQGTCPP